MKTKTERTIVYHGSGKFAFPRWLRTRLSSALKAIRGRDADRFESRDQLSELFELGRACGFYVDHPGRKGSVLTIEPYSDALDVEAVERFAEALRCDFEIDELGSQWNPPRTVLITLLPIFRN